MYRILVVDDEVIIATQLEERLTFMGYQVVGMAASGEEAVRMARDLAPDLVLMDIVMPGGIDGIAAAEQIRGDLGIPFVFVTAYTDWELIERAKGLQPLGYILKPFQDEQITAAIEIAVYNEKTARRLRESEDRYRKLVEVIPHGIVETDNDLTIVFANQAFHRMHGYGEEELAGRNLCELLESWSDAPELRASMETPASSEDSGPNQWLGKGLTRDGSVLDVQLDWNYKRDADGRAVGFIHVVTDITERLRAEGELKRARDELEASVEQRTRELVRTNALLKQEINERRKAEEELEAKRESLEEVNTALKVLLKKREENRLELEEKVILNMKELVTPYLDKLRRTQMNQTQKAFLEILEANLNDIVSPFSKSLSSRFWNLTPSELRIANLIRQGKTTKEISYLLNLSHKTIETHRKNIRKKLNIGGKRSNLRSHLLSIQ